MIKACIFDLDGTLANTLESMAYVTNEIMKKFGLKTLKVDDFRYYCGEGADMLMRRCLRDAGDPELTRYEEGRMIYREMFAKDPMYHVSHYPGMPETIHALLDMGIKLGVCTNKPYLAAEKVIDVMFPGDFDLVLGQKPEIRRKPDPESALMIAGHFGFNPEECLYVGDTATDMKTGKAAGMYTVGALWGFRDEKELLESGADVLAETPEDLLDLIDEVNSHD